MFTVPQRTPLPSSPQNTHILSLLLESSLLLFGIHLLWKLSLILPLPCVPLEPVSAPLIALNLLLLMSPALTALFLGFQQLTQGSEKYLLNECSEEKRMVVIKTVLTVIC